MSRRAILCRCLLMAAVISSYAAPISRAYAEEHGPATTSGAAAICPPRNADRALQAGGAAQCADGVQPIVATERSWAEFSLSNAESARE